MSPINMPSKLAEEPIQNRYNYIIEKHKLATCNGEEVLNTRLLRSNQTTQIHDTSKIL
jgi:hypothetical protein